MTKLELVERVARKLRLTKKSTEEALDAFLQEIGAEATRAPVRLPRFGTFRPTLRKARNIRDLVTAQTRKLPAAPGVGFRAAKELRAKAAKEQRRILRGRGALLDRLAALAQRGA